MNLKIYSDSNPYLFSGHPPTMTDNGARRRRTQTLCVGHSPLVAPPPRHHSPLDAPGPRLLFLPAAASPHLPFLPAVGPEPPRRCDLVVPALLLFPRPRRPPPLPPRSSDPLPPRGCRASGPWRRHQPPSAPFFDRPLKTVNLVLCVTFTVK
jgi:hypothetical protein